MGDKKVGKDKTIIKIGRLGITKQLGRTLSHEGVTEILNVLVERPKQYTEIAMETVLPNSTLERSLKELQAVKLIETNTIYSKKRKTGRGANGTSQQGNKVLQNNFKDEFL